MAYTTFDQLEKNPDGSTIFLPNNNMDPNTLFYEVDLEIVRNQAGFSRLKTFRVIFKRVDGSNQGIETINVMAAIDTNAAPIQNLGGATGNGKVALAWPPYYHDDDPNYAPGNLLNKN